MSSHQFTKFHNRRFNEICKYLTAVSFSCVKFVISADDNTGVTVNLSSVVNCHLQFLYVVGWLVVNKSAIRLLVLWNVTVGKATFRTVCKINDMCYTICILPKQILKRCALAKDILNFMNSTKMNATLNPLYMFVILILLLRET